MADSKISALTEDTAPSGDDLIVTVNDPGGTPANRKARLRNIKGAVLAEVSYKPGSDTDTTTASTSVVDVDAAHLSISFDAPASGQVRVELFGQAANSAGDVYSGLRDGSTTVALGLAAKSGGGYTIAQSFLISGLTPGTSYTYKWAWKVSASTAHFYNGPTYGQSTMRVLSA